MNHVQYQNVVFVIYDSHSVGFYSGHPSIKWHKDYFLNTFLLGHIQNMDYSLFICACQCKG